MRFSVPRIMPVMLLFHLGMGCCWHHTHTFGMDRRDLPVATAETGGCGDHAHDAAQDTQRGHRADTPHRIANPHQHSCDGDRCTFARSKPPPEPRDVSNFFFCSCDIPQSPTNSERIDSRQAQGQDYLFRSGGLPLRAHLLFGVLLI